MRIIFILAILILGCAKEKPIPREKLLKGWAGSPDNLQSKPFDYYYMKLKGQTSENTSKRKSKDMMEWACIKSATINARIDLSIGIVYESGIDECNMCGCFGCAKNPDDFSKARLPFVELATCATDYPPNPVLSALRSEIKEKLEVEYSDCKPIVSANRNIQGREWRECECTVYAHIPGGRKAVWQQCIELEKKFNEKR